MHELNELRNRLVEGIELHRVVVQEQDDEEEIHNDDAVVTNCVISIDSEEFVCATEKDSIDADRYSIPLFMHVMRSGALDLTLVFGDLTLNDGEQVFPVYTGIKPAPVVRFDTLNDCDEMERLLPLVFDLVR
jgi:hypothetical protein